MLSDNKNSRNKGKNIDDEMATHSWVESKQLMGGRVSTAQNKSQRIFHSIKTNKNSCDEVFITIVTQRPFSCILFVWFGFLYLHIRIGRCGMISMRTYYGSQTNHIDVRCVLTSFDFLSTLPVSFEFFFRTFLQLIDIYLNWKFRCFFIHGMRKKGFVMRSPFLRISLKIK